MTDSASGAPAQQGEDSPDHWGIIARVLDELVPATPLLVECERHPEAFRAFNRWFFSALETFAFALKGIAIEHAKRANIQLSRRESQVLQIVEEPRFPGLPPPRRVEAPLRESLNTAIRVFARARKSTPPMPDESLPYEFIEATAMFDRISRPASVADLSVSPADYVAMAKTVVWFRDVQHWLTRERLAELDEVKAEIAASTASLIRKFQKDKDG
jgi:hypothetical protein